MSQRDIKWQSLRIVIMAGALGAAAAAFGDAKSRNDVPAIGARVDDFTAGDCLGANHSLSELSKSRIVVLAFLGVDCPLARLYAPRLGELARRYEGKGVVFMGVDANRQDSLTAISAFAKDRQICFPILKDLRQRIANQVGVKRTPEVVVLDRDRRIRYRGRIDDQFGFVPTNRAVVYRKVSVEKRDLEAAIDDLLATKKVATPETKAAGCLIGRDGEPNAHSRVTYTKDVARILNKSCIACHRAGQIGPFPLTNFEDAAGWADMIVEVTESGRMPPWHADPKYGRFANDARMSDADRRTLAQWAAAGAPEGNRRDLPKEPKFTVHWTIPAPDQVVQMPEAVEVPTTGVIELQTIVVDPRWSEDHWISAIEVRPSAPSVVHHILIFVISPLEPVTTLKAEDSFLAAYVPGMRAETLPDGYVRKVAAGSRLVFNVHYTPNGTPQKDRSFVGLKFAEPKSVRHQVTVCGAINNSFTIPPGARNYEVRARYAFNRDSRLLSLAPHMHFRGKDFLYEAVYPDGRREVLLSVPRYDFNWQTMYRLAEPKLMPKGTVLECAAHFDNSAENLNNPDPSRTVAFGWQSFEEMMVGYFETTPAQVGLIDEPLLSTFHRLPIFLDYILAAVLASISVSILGVLGFRVSRRRSSRST
jgi:peroxiredoxin/mono/diheme cytochrome c family protein